MRVLSISLMLITGTCFGQWDVPVRLILDGPAPEDRQVTGLADPTSTDAGMSVDAYRRHVVSSAQSTGGSTLVAVLDPPATSYDAGMSIYLTLSSFNSPGCSIRLNDLEDKPVVKWGGLPLDSADLIPNVPNRFVYDGERFQYMGAVLIPCPSGYSIGNNNFCIEDNVRPAATFYQAASTCRQQGGRLCSFADWLFACPRLFESQLTTDAEWVDSAANSANTAKTVGYGSNGTTTDLGIGCQRGTNRSPTLEAPFRCCTTR